MAAARGPITGKKWPSGRNWAKLGIGRILHRFTRGTRRKFHPRARRGSKGDRHCSPRKAKRCSRSPAHDATTRMSTLEITSSDKSEEIRATGSPTNTLVPTLWRVDSLDKSSRYARPAKLYLIKQSRTFPQSNREKARDIMLSSSIDARLAEAREEEGTGAGNVARHEGTSRRSRQPVPDGFQELTDEQKRELYEKYTIDVQLKAAQVAAWQESGGEQAARNSVRFVEIWESKLLRKLEQVLDDSGEKEYTVNVTRGAEPGSHTIVIMTQGSLTGEVERQLLQSKSGMLPGDLDSTTTMLFRQGRVSFLNNNPGTSPSRVSSIDDDGDDPCISPLNTNWSPEPTIGDSVGWKDESATLGPLLQVNQRFCRLVCWHLFDDKAENRRWDHACPPRDLSTDHPSRTDYPDGPRTPMGDVVAYSGQMYKTSRPSISIQEEDTNVVTDWALLDVTESGPQSNIVRRLDGTSGYSHKVEITQVEDPASFIQRCNQSRSPYLVYSVGRTSGYTTGQLGLTYGSYKLPCGLKTRNWIVEEVKCGSGGGNEMTREWIRAGMGVPGDSGAGVFGFQGNELLGQVWGRNTYDSNDPEPRVTLFTAMTDIYADIVERMPGLVTVQLPTWSPVKERVHAERDLAIWQIDDRASASVAEILDDADLHDDLLDQGQEKIGHRSAAVSRRLGAVMALGKKAGFLERPGRQPFHSWARAIIHAATF